jgi:hypothetical protein
MSETILEKKSGQFKTEKKFIEFIGAKGQINFIANEATIEAKYLTGLGLEDVVFKLTIFEDGSVDFEEVDGAQTTAEQRFRFLQDIEENTLQPFRSKMVIGDLPFQSCKEVSGKKINLYLSVDYQKPITNLAKVVESNIQVNEDQTKKLDLLFSLFDEDEVEELAEETIEEKVEVEEKSDVVTIDWRTNLNGAFEESKSAKIFELENKLESKRFDLGRNLSQISTLQRSVDEIESEIELIKSRLESLKPAKIFNGYYFNVSENLNEKVDLSPEIEEAIKTKVSKVKGINVDNFMKLFVSAEFEIRLAQKVDSQFVEVDDMKSLTSEIVALFHESRLKFSLEDGILLYKGDNVWADVVNEMIKLGFGQDAEWDKICGSNSFSQNN